MRPILRSILINSLLLAIFPTAPAESAAADLDPSFGAGGKVTTDFGVGFSDLAGDLVLQDDGRIVAAGLAGVDFGLARYNTDGTLDPEFGSGGKVTTDFSGFDQASAVLLQPDGKIVAAGVAAQGSGNANFVLARYNGDGSLDPSFGAAGKVTTDFAGSDDFAFDLVLQEDGKLVVAGRSAFEVGPPFGVSFDFALARYNADGSLDLGFGTGGRVTTDFAGGSDGAFVVLVQPDGKLVAGGLSSAGGFPDFALARYDPDGSLDMGFGTEGKVTTDFAGSFDQIADLRQQSDGKLVAAGSSNVPPGGFDFALARYDHDGSLDATFGTDGKVTTDLGRQDFGSAIVILPDGRLLVAGTKSVDFGLARYTAVGDLDPEFGTNGVVTTDFAGGNDGASALLLQPDGKFVAAGQTDNFALVRDFALARYLGDPTSTTYVVNTTDDTDDGSCDEIQCSLREAIAAANGHPGADTVLFRIPGDGPHTIAPGSPLPSINEAVTLDGASQPGFAGSPVIELDGTNAGEGVNGLVIAAAETVVRGFVINRFSAIGIEITGGGTTESRVEGNFIGTDVTGTVALSNGAEGVIVHQTAANNTIGGEGPGAGNVISGNSSSGINIFDEGTTGNRVQGNLIGTDASGTVALGNAGAGVLIDSAASDNLVGGTTAGARNIISGNAGSGVTFSVAGTTGNVVQGNFIGTDITGMANLGNSANGIDLIGGVSNNLIGGSEAGAGNTVSGNAGNGVAIFDPGTAGNLIQGNYIGTDLHGTASIPNASNGVLLASGASDNLIGGTGQGAGNVISGNGGDGVAIVEPGTTGNTVQGNFIGTDLHGRASLPNGGNGVLLAGGASDNVAGGTDVAARNVISGNSASGVGIFNLGTVRNMVQGNYIGTDLTGTAPLANSEPGVGIGDQAADNLIGGSEDGAGNLISGNASDGVAIFNPGTMGNRVLGNYIGTDVTGTLALGNAGAGVVIVDQAADNLIGGTQEAARNVVSGNGWVGVGVFNPGTLANIVQGNFIGTDVHGTAPLGNGAAGIAIGDQASDNLIGGAEAGAGNLISGNASDGVAIFNPGTTGNVLQGNFIGTDVTGTLPLGNAGFGVVMGDQTTDNLIGGAGEGAGNLVSANASDGVALFDPGTTGNVIQGNYIGTDVSGTAALPNEGVGVWIGFGASNNAIGGAADGEGNLISGNRVHGVSINHLETVGTLVQGNLVGTDVTGTTPLPNLEGGVATSGSQTLIGGTEPGSGNTIGHNGGFGVMVWADAGNGNSILGNSISGNAGLGVDLNEDGVSPNDPRDRDGGPNDLQNFPVLSPPVLFQGSIKVAGVLASQPNSTYRIEFFRVAACDDSGYGEGDMFLGFIEVTTAPSGFATFVFELPSNFPQDAFVTATATDPAGSTSEFSQCAGPVVVVGGGR